MLTRLIDQAVVGDARHRFYIEDNLIVSANGPASLYTWSYEPLYS